MHLVSRNLHAKLQVYSKGQALLDCAKLAISAPSYHQWDVLVVSNTLTGAVRMTIRTWLSHQSLVQRSLSDINRAYV